MVKLSNQANETRRRTAVRFLKTISLAAVLSLAAGCSLLPEEEQPLAPPLVKPAQARIVTEEPRVGRLEKAVQGMATFEPVRMAYHQYTEGGGRVAEVLAKAGDEVKAGDPLLRLDMGPLYVTLLQRQLELERKLLALDEAKEARDERRLKIALLEVEIAQIMYDSVAEAYENSILKAQMDGVVTFAANLQPGDVIQPYQTLFIVADPGRMRLAFSVVSTSSVNDVQVGMEAEITFQNQKYIGKVVQTPASAPFEQDERLRERYARTLYIDLEPTPEGAKIGDMASVRILTDVRENALILPRGAVRRMFGRTYVQVLEGESRREIDVQTGLETQTEIEIISGLEPGVKVILP